MSCFSKFLDPNPQSNLDSNPDLDPDPDPNDQLPQFVSCS